MGIRHALRGSRVDSASSHHPHTSAPVFIDIKSINLNVGGNRLRQSRERWMKAKCRRDQINQRRFIADFSIAKKFGAADMSAAAMRFDAPPVIDALEDMLAIFADLQFNDCQSAVVSQRQ